MRRTRVLKNGVCMVGTIFIALMLMTTFAFGQGKYPSKPITLVVGLAAGGATDLSARALGRGVERILKQPVIVSNKTGGSTAISLSYVKTSLPDGYTLGVSATGSILGPHLQKVPYEFFEDFTHLIQFSLLPGGIVVHSDSPWKTLKEFIEYAQKNPGKIKYACTERGSQAMLQAEQFAGLNGFKWVHVPFPGDPPAAAALLGKHVDAMLLGPVSWGPFVKEGKFRLLGALMEKRFKDFPDVPTVTELGIKWYSYAPFNAVYGILAPKGLPSNVQDTLLSALREAWKNPEFQETLEKLSIMPVYREGEDWIQFLREWDKEGVSIMKQIGMTLVKE